MFGKLAGSREDAPRKKTSSLLTTLFDTSSTKKQGFQEDKV
jgi:hypothetical protein